MIVSNSFYCMECIHHALAILPTSHNLWLMFANQLWADQFGTWLIAKLFYSVHNKLRTCGADFKIYEVADFKIYKVADLRLRTSRIIKLQTCGCRFKNPEAPLRTRLLNMQLRTCGCGLRKLKFSCKFVDCGLKKNLRCPALMKPHEDCFACQYYTSNSCLCIAKVNTGHWRYHVFGLGKKTLRTCSRKPFQLLKKIQEEIILLLILKKKSIFCKTFSALLPFF